MEHPDKRHLRACPPFVRVVVVAAAVVEHTCPVGVVVVVATNDTVLPRRDCSKCRQLPCGDDSLPVVFPLREGVVVVVVVAVVVAEEEDIRRLVAVMWEPPVAKLPWDGERLGRRRDCLVLPVAYFHGRHRHVLVRLAAAAAAAVVAVEQGIDCWKTFASVFLCSGFLVSFFVSAFDK